MNVRLNLDLSFIAGVWFNNQLLMNQYLVNCNLITNTEEPGDVTIAVDRLRWWISNVAQNSIFIQNTETDKQQQFWGAQMNLVILPEVPTDQIIGMMLYSKLNAITEKKVLVADIQIASMLSDGMRYIFDDTDDYGVFLDDGWWNDADPIWWNKELISSKDEDGTLKLNPVIHWKDVQLHWTADEVKEGNVVVHDFKKDDKR